MPRRRTPCPPCTPCEGCPPLVAGTVCTEEFGDGCIVLFADEGGLFLTCGRHALNEPLFDALFSRVSGTVAGMTLASNWRNDAGASFRPTVSYTSGGSLSGIGCLYAGMRGGSLPDVPSNSSDIATWVQGGGVLFLIVENSDIIANAISECNGLLEDMGACSSFENTKVTPDLCSQTTGSIGAPMSINPSHSWVSISDTAYCVKTAKAWGEEWLYRQDGVTW